VFHDDQHDPPAPLTSWACITAPRPS